MCVCLNTEFLAQALAVQGNTTSKDFVYEIINGKVRITGYTGNGSVVNIPATIAGIDVTAIGGKAFADMPWIREIILPEGIERIENEAFYNCTGITEITLPQSLHTILGRGFCGCDGLTVINIPKGVVSIGGGSFSAKNIETIVVEEGNQNYIVDGNCLIEIPDNPEKMITLVSAARDFEIPEYVEAIDSGCFFENENITEVELPDTIEYIGGRAFEGCENLLVADMPESLQIIENSAFRNCINLKEVIFPVNIELRIQSGSGFFYNCRKLEIIELPHGMPEIDNTMFGKCSKLEYIKIRSGMSLISNLSWCTSLKRIEIPGEVGKIAESAFAGCQEVTIYGVEGSVAHEFALKNGIPFESIR